MCRRRTLYGVRGLKYVEDSREPLTTRRTPYGVRGLKFVYGQPAAGKTFALSRTPYGVRGLKSVRLAHRLGEYQSRTPYGVRGLKFETRRRPKDFPVRFVAPRMGCVD